MRRLWAGVASNEVDNLRTATEGQLEAAKVLLTPPPAVTATAEPFSEMLQAWNAAVRQLMGSAAPPSQRERGSS